jgi:hypothetical protein
MLIMEQIICIHKTGNFIYNSSFSTFSRACDLRNHLANYTFLNFRSDSAQFFDEELGPFLQTQNVSDHALTYIRDRMTSTRTKHANTTPELATFLQHKIQSSPELLEKFLRIFYHDYTTFNFPFPELIK